MIDTWSFSDDPGRGAPNLLTDLASQRVAHARKDLARPLGPTAESDRSSVLRPVSTAAA